MPRLLAVNETPAPRPNGRKDRSISYMCFRLQHKKCKGRTCMCECHMM